mmetsp:Transcript_29418/g.5317  ORF Transcript_29418/g.5317 Transcript_29418/m.5317 type:complete len:99 (-) Transcript_29418:840-1136(-)
MILIAGPFNFIGANVAMFLGTRVTVIIGLSIAILGVFLSSFATSFSVFFITYGIMFGIGVGFAYTSPLMAGWSNYPDHKGRVTGIIMAGFGLSATIFN